MRRWTFAVSEYRAGKQHLSEYVSDLPRTNTRISLFLAALGHFENCVIQTYLALMALRAVVRMQTRQKDWDAYKLKDGNGLVVATFNETCHDYGTTVATVRLRSPLERYPHGMNRM